MNAQGVAGDSLYRALVAYDGTGYAGFQLQADRPTIQGELERALRQLTQQAVRVHGAGRTDAGVHAIGQVISFETAWRHGPQELERALNALLPAGIAVRGLSWAEAGFHARYSAIKRVYLYSVYESAVRWPQLDRFALRVRSALDWEAVQAATQSLVGENDFAAFGQPPAGLVTIRRVHRAEWLAMPLRQDPWLGQAIPGHALRIEANAFLRGMVRRIVGALLAVGMGLLTPGDVAEILASCDISRASPPAPACGLCLAQVVYPEREERDRGVAPTGASSEAGDRSGGCGGHEAPASAW